MIGLRDDVQVKRPASELARTQPGLLADILMMLVLGVLYYVAARLSLRLALIEMNVTPLWPPTGIALVAFLIFGRRLWPAIAVAAFLVNAPISTSVLAAAATAVGNTLAPLLAGFLLTRVGFRLEIDRLRDAVAIVFLGALLSMSVSATIGSLALVLSDAIPRSEFPSAWSVWWAGDAMGVLIVAPFLLSLRLWRHYRLRGWARPVEAFVLFTALIAASYGLVRSDLPILFLVLPLIGLAAWRFQLTGAAPAALVGSVFATWAAQEGQGSFAGETLAKTMLQLQSLNAAIAITSLVLAAVVTERVRAKEALERAAADLEERVHRRTRELSVANAKLAEEIRERRHAEAKLRESERLLVEAEQVAQIGSWEWDIAEDRVTWSDEMFRIHGYQPQEFPVTFERAVELVVLEDRGTIQANVARAMSDRIDPPDIEYRIVRVDGEERVLRGRARLVLGPQGEPVRMFGTVQDATERIAYEREHLIAETLQNALLPQDLPHLEWVSFGARYVPAGKGVDVGGDWYDVIQLRDGSVAVVMGDVAGRGLDAATVMAHLRMAVRAYAVEGHPPAAVVTKAHVLLQQLAPEQMVTLLYLVLDPIALEARFVNAGHLPPLLIPADGAPSYLETEPALPVGLDHLPQYREFVAKLEERQTLVLFTDGLVESRRVPLTEGLARLDRAARGGPGESLGDFCDRLIDTLLPEQMEDDVALLALQLQPVTSDGFRLRLPAHPNQLAPVRRRLAGWLALLGVDNEVAYDIILACAEACSNAIEHAYGSEEGYLELEGTLANGEIELVIRDFGRWRASRSKDRGRGLRIIETVMDSVSVTRGDHGTEVRMRRSLSGVGTP